MKYIITFFLVFIFMLNMASSQNVGEVAPNFTLKDLGNVDYTLSENKGDVILVFLVGYNCSFCIAGAPTIKSKIIEAFAANQKFQALVIDVWNGSTSSVQNFKNTTGLNAKYLQKGSTVASSWSTTHDRLFVCYRF